MNLSLFKDLNTLNRKTEYHPKIMGELKDKPRLEVAKRPIFEE